jgi:serine phosphatase RsbU (regulator of sigma subunit)
MSGRTWTVRVSRSTLAPLLVVAVFAGIDIAAGPERVVLGLVVIAPLLAATLTGPRLTAAYAVLALIAAALLGVYDRQHTPEAWPAQAVRLAGVALGGGIAVAAASARLRRESRLQELVVEAARAELRAREAEQRAEFAEVLQRRILRDPPRLPGLEVAVRYRPASDHAEVGGDWYDAFRLQDGRSVLVVGDVAGHDGDAAALMAQVRSTVRAISHVLHGSPAAVLTELDQVLRRLDEQVLASIVLAHIEPTTSPPPPPTRRATGRPGGQVEIPEQRDHETGEVCLRWSNAGHPPPLFLPVIGAPRLLEYRPDPLLGVVPHVTRQDHAITIAAGDGLVLFTDGLVERRGVPIDDGLGVIRSAAAAAAGRPVGALADALMDCAPTTGRTDDVALLAVRSLPRSHVTTPWRDEVSNGATNAPPRRENGR